MRSKRATRACGTKPRDLSERIIKGNSPGAIGDCPPPPIVALHFPYERLSFSLSPSTISTIPLNPPISSAIDAFQAFSRSYCYCPPPLILTKAVFCFWGDLFLPILYSFISLKSTVITGNFTPTRDAARLNTPVQVDIPYILDHPHQLGALAESERGFFSKFSLSISRHLTFNYLKTRRGNLKITPPPPPSPSSQARRDFN